MENKRSDLYNHPKLQSLKPCQDMTQGRCTRTEVGRLPGAEHPRTASRLEDAGQSEREHLLRVPISIQDSTGNCVCVRKPRLKKYLPKMVRGLQIARNNNYSYQIGKPCNSKSTVRVHRKIFLH